MPRYSYECSDLKGVRTVDTADAHDRDELLLRLQSRGLVLIRWLDDAPGRARWFKARKTLKTEDLLDLTREMAHLLKSGIPVDRTLAVVAESTPVPAVRETVTYLKSSLQAGSSLSQAMAERSQDFSSLYVNMVRVGEMGGILALIMEKLGEFLDRTEEIKRFIVSSSIYPAILMGVGFISILVIVGFVVPRFAGIFKDLGQKIPMSTQMLITLSAFFQQWWWAMAVGLVAAVWAVWHIVHTARGRAMVDRIAVRLPIFGLLLVDIEISRFSRTLGILVQSGVPLLKALSIVQAVVGNSLVKEAVGFIFHKVKAGNRISALMKERFIFPPMVVQMVSLGEETGKIGEMLVNVSDELDKKIQTRIKRLLALLEPVAILVMGLIIGAVVISMLSAILGIDDVNF